MGQGLLIGLCESLNKCCNCLKVCSILKPLQKIFFLWMTQLNLNQQNPCMNFFFNEFAKNDVWSRAFFVYWHSAETSRTLISPNAHQTCFLLSVKNNMNNLSLKMISYLSRFLNRHSFCRGRCRFFLMVDSYWFYHLMDHDFWLPRFFCFPIFAWVLRNTPRLVQWNVSRCRLREWNISSELTADIFASNL